MNFLYSPLAKNITTGCTQVFGTNIFMYDVGITGATEIIDRLYKSAGI